MRPLLATACVCLLATSGSIASDQKPLNDRVPSAVAPVPAATTANATTISEHLKAVADHLSPPNDTFDPLPLAGKPVQLATAADAPVDIPAQSGTAAVLAPRDLPSPPQPKPKAVVHRSTEEVCDTVKEAAQRNDLPVPFFIRLLFQESRFKPGAVSGAGAQGIAQFMPKTADAVGLDNPFDPLQAIPASARLLRDLVEQFGNVGLAAAAYNAGPKRIHDWLARKSKLPEETQGYVKTITGRPAENWKQASNGTPAIKLPARAPCQEAAGLLAYNGPDEIPVPPVPTRHKAKVARVQKPSHNASVRVAARHHHGRGKGTISLAARRKEPHGHHRSAGHRLASAD